MNTNPIVIDVTRMSTIDELVEGLATSERFKLGYSTTGKRVVVGPWSLCYAVGGEGPSEIENFRDFFGGSGRLVETGTWEGREVLYKVDKEEPVSIDLYREIQLTLFGQSPF